MEHLTESDINLTVPEALRAVDPDVLRRYVEDCVRKRVAEVMYEQEERARSVRPRLADRIASAPAELGPSGEGSGDKSSLAFRHDCTVFVGCSMTDTCQMCCHSIQNECSSRKFKRAFEDEVVSTECGAKDVWVELVPSPSGLSPHNPEGLAVEFVLLDSVEYDARVPAEQCQRVLCQNRTLLGSKLQGPGPNNLIKVPLRYDGKTGRYAARLPDLYVTKNAKHVRSRLELKHVRDPGFRLMARVVDLQRQDTPRDDIRPAISHPFRVVVEKAGSGNTTNPMLDDPVKVLPGIGPETLGKLLDIGATAAARNHNVPFSCISTVGNMQELLAWCRPNNFPRETIRQILNVPRPVWNEIIVLVENAKLNDSDLRIWYSGQDCEKGLLFACKGGVIRASEPKGLLMRVENEEEDHAVMEMYELMSMHELELAHGEIHEGIKELLGEAKKAWHRPGHPGWAIWEIQTDYFLQNWIVPSDERCYAPIPMSPGWDPSQGQPGRKVVMEVKQRKPGAGVHCAKGHCEGLRCSGTAAMEGSALPPPSMRVDGDNAEMLAPVSPFLIAAGSPYVPDEPSLPRGDVAVPGVDQWSLLMSGLSNRISGMAVRDGTVQATMPHFELRDGQTISHMDLSQQVFSSLHSWPEWQLSGLEPLLDSRISAVVEAAVHRKEFKDILNTVMSSCGEAADAGVTEALEAVMGRRGSAEMPLELLLQHSVPPLTSSVMGHLGSWLSDHMDTDPTLAALTPAVVSNALPAPMHE